MATTTRRQRHKHDKYYTNRKLTQVLLDNQEIAGNILECCAGERHISDYLKDTASTVEGYERTVMATDITDNTKSRPTDATTRDFWQYYCDRRCYLFETHWTVTNPPFKLAHEIIPLAYEYSQTGIAMLLRLTYLEPCANRSEWLHQNSDQLAKVIPVNPRPRFRTDTKSTDSATVAWFVWDKRHSWKAHGLDCPFVFAHGWNK